MPLTPGARLRSYEILESIGAGGMGEVYRARDTKLGREVAVKVLPEAFSQDRERLVRFEREARLLASLNHPNIATLFDLQEYDGTHFLVLEFVPGENLAERITRGPIQGDEALPLFKQIAEALEAAHEKGIIHRDLKPSNIKVTPEGKVKVLDFGLAKALAVEGPAADFSQSPTLTKGTALGAVMGTAAYMSPEQARGKAVDERTDIWAFGCCLFEVLTGQPAFEGETVSDTISAILRGEPDWKALSPDAPASARRLLRRCLQKDPRARLHDIADARLEIDEALTEPQGPSVGTTAARLPVSRFVITLPPDQHLEGYFACPIAISPDGTRLVYAAGKHDHPPQLYLRALNEFDARPIAGTEGAASPFFSPDGKWVGFFAGNKLHKVSVTGGAPLVICEFWSAHAGGSWVSDDIIIFGNALLSGLFRVAASGGTPEELTRPDSDRGEVAHGWPQILPDEKNVLATLETGEGSLIAVLSLKTGEWHRILEGSKLLAAARYIPSGHLLTAPSGGLLAVPFDLARLESKGSPIPILDGVHTSVTNVGWFAVSQTGTLAYVPGRRDRKRMVWVDREGQATPVTEDRGDFLFPRLSPDGRKVAVMIQSGSREDIWVYDLDRGTRIRLTTEGRYNISPVWTPDGKRIAFGSSRSGLLSTYWKPADGSGEAEPLPTGGPANIPFSWSPDGRVLAVDAAHDILVLNVEGDRTPSPFLVTPFNTKSPRFSPDGCFIAYTSDESGRDEVYVQAYPGPGEKVAISTGGGRGPVWSADGRELFFRSGDQMMAADVKTDPTFTVGKPRRLFEGHYVVEPARHTDYDVAPDGQRFVMIQVNEESAPTQINVVLNWFEELKQLVPTEND